MLQRSHLSSWETKECYLFIFICSEPNTELTVFHPTNSYQAPVKGQSQCEVVMMLMVRRWHSPCSQVWEWYTSSKTETSDNSLAKRAEREVLEFRGAEKYMLTLGVSQGSQRHDCMYLRSLLTHVNTEQRNQRGGVGDYIVHHKAHCT